VQQIKALLARPEFAETEQSLALLQGMALAARVRAALRADDATHNVDVSIESTSAGRVALRGIVANSDEREAAEKVSASVAGVTGVDNELRVMATSRLFTSSKN
jgi:hypothetical protein